MEDYSKFFLDYPGETAAAVKHEGRCAIVLKSAYDAKRYPNRIISVTPMAYMLSEGPVLRLHFQFINQFTNKPIYTGETFLNIDDPLMAELILSLAKQDVFEFHCYNMDFVYVSSMRINWSPATRRDMPGIIRQMLEHLATIPVEERDFMNARRRIMDEEDN